MKKKINLFLFTILLISFLIPNVSALTTDEIINARKNGRVLGENGIVCSDSMKQYSFVLGDNAGYSGLSRGGVSEYGGYTPESLYLSNSVIYDLIYKYNVDYRGRYSQWTSGGMDNTISQSFAYGDKVKGQYYAIYKKVGKYGKYAIDVKTTVMDYDSVYETTGGFASVIGFHKTPGTSVLNVRWVTVKYEFCAADAWDDNYNCKVPVDVKGYTTYWDVDWDQGIILHDNKDDIFYDGRNAVNDNDKLQITYLQDGSTYVYNSNHKDAKNNANPENAFTETFHGSSITRTYTYGDTTKQNYKTPAYNEWIGASGGMYNASKPICGQKYDYYVDAACTNCDSTIEDNKAYVFQDTTDWNAIMNSKSADATTCYENIGNYYTSDGKTFCRDEFYVYLPNQNSKVKINLGRYFVLNAEDWIGIPSFNPVKVKRIRQCRSTEGKTALETYNTETALNTFTTACTGDITLKYNEKTYATKDSSDYIKLNRRLDSSKREYIDDQTLQFEAVYYYDLPDNVYRYVRMVDGKAVKGSPKDNVTYRDLGMSVLPISFGTSKTFFNEVSLQFAYSLPDYSCSGTHLKDSNNYMKIAETCGSVENVYQKGDNSQLLQSSCAKLYGVTNANDLLQSGSASAKCVNDQVDNNGTSKCFENSSKVDSYKCILNDKCETKEDAKRLGVKWNYKCSYCCPPGTTPNGCLCEPDSPGEPDPECKTEEDATNLGLCWNYSDDTCCPEGTCYNPETGKCSGSSLDVIYRVINLTEPFIKRSGATRDVGDNWCYYDNGQSKYVCSSDRGMNKVVEKVIPSTTVYSEDHVMYRVVLDSKAINNIRAYNRGTDYNDFNLRCNAQGEKCVSEFLNDPSHFKEPVSGNCAGLNANSDRFYSCKEAH